MRIVIANGFLLVIMGILDMFQRSIFQKKKFIILLKIIHQDKLDIILILEVREFSLLHIILLHLLGQLLYAEMEHIVLVKAVEELALIMVVLQNG